jgi:hypothetical protein
MSWATYSGLSLPTCMRCCAAPSCAIECRSKTQPSTTLPACDTDPDSWACDTIWDPICGLGDTNLGTVTFSASATPVSDNCDGTWLYEVTFSETHTGSATVTNLTLDGNTSPYNINIAYCGSVSLTGASIHIDYTGGDPGCSETDWNVSCDVEPTAAFAPGFQYWDSPLLAALIEYADLPYDDPPDCVGTLSAVTPCTGEYSFTLFENQATLTNLTVGLCYTVSYTLEWRQTDLDSWEVFFTFELTFTATMATEVTDWLGPYPDGTDPRGSSPGYQMRMTPGSCTVVEVPCA